MDASPPQHTCTNLKEVINRPCAMEVMEDDDSQLELSSKASGTVRYVPLHSQDSPPQPSFDEGAVDLLQAHDIEELNNDALSRVSNYSHYFKFSNFCFFLGSVLYVFTNTWSVIDAYRYYGEEDDDDEKSGDGDYESEPFWNAYKLLTSAAALMYLANALVDGQVAVAEVRRKVGSGRFGDDPRWEIGVAITFGVAALCDFLSELIWNDDNMWPGYAAGCAAVDIYLLNAVLVISGRKPIFTSLPQSLMSSGDILFLIGSIIDVMISFLDNPKAPSSRSIEIAWSSFASSVLWFLDSLLYILADHLEDDDDYSSVESVSSQNSDDSVQDVLEISSTVAPASPEPVNIDGNIKDSRLHQRKSPSQIRHPMHFIKEPSK